MEADKLVAYGYKYGEKKLDSISFSPCEFTITATGAKLESLRDRPVAVSLGFMQRGVCLPHPSLTDPVTTQAGVLKRFLRATPNPLERGPISLEGLKKYVRNWVKRLTPIDASYDMSVENWLSQTNYPESRKAELREKWDRCGGVLSPKHYKVKSFVKDEFYPEFKHARAINSRSDEFKCAFGPWIKAMEHIVYQQPDFIKHVPVAERPGYIESRLYVPGAKYFWADFTAFESHFKREVFEEIEFVLYRHLASKHPMRSKLWPLLDVLSGVNFCSFKHFVVKCEARRMSGEMNTSLGNGFVNLMLINYLFSVYGENNVTVVEGDDSNTRFMRNCPTVEDFAKLGFTVKCGVTDHLEHMSFCGLVYDREDKINIPDPYKALAGLGWARSSYCRFKRSKLLALLRVKALSYAHQYPGAPVVQELAHAALRCTRGYDAVSFFKRDRHMNMWERDRVAEFIGNRVPYVETPMATRHLCEKVYGMTVHEQIKVETILKGINNMGEFDVGVEFPKAWNQYYEEYTHVASDRDMDYPVRPVYTYPGFELEFEPVVRDYRAR